MNTEKLFYIEMIKELTTKFRKIKALINIAECEMTEIIKLEPHGLSSPPPYIPFSELKINLGLLLSDFGAFFDDLIDVIDNPTYINEDEDDFLRAKRMDEVFTKLLAVFKDPNEYGMDIRDIRGFR